MKDNRRAFLEKLDRTWPGLAKAFRKAMQAVRDGVVMRDLEEAIARGDVQAALRAVQMDEDALFALDRAIEEAFRAGGDYQIEAAQQQTRRFPAGARVVQSFGGRHPRAEQAIREMGAKLVSEVTQDQQDLIRAAVLKGLDEGRAPRDVAVEIAGRVVNSKRKGGLIGLHSSQATYVQNMRADLADPDRLSRYFRRGRRDKRFDASVRKAIREGRGLSAKQIEKISGRYAERLLMTRSESIARTETHKALSGGRYEAVLQLVEKGKASPAQVTRKWDATGDGRTRPTHMAAEGQTVGLHGSFSIGGHPVMFPGDSSLGAPASETVQCRCYEEIKIDWLAS